MSKIKRIKRTSSVAKVMPFPKIRGKTLVGLGALPMIMPKKSTLGIPVDLHERKIVGSTGATYAGIPDIDFSAMDFAPGTADKVTNILEAKKLQIMEKLLAGVNTLSSTNLIKRGFIGRTISVGTSAVEIVNSDFIRGTIILNPATLLGTTSSGALLASAARTADGNTQSSSLGVANFRDMHLYLDVTAVTGTDPTLKIWAQTKDPVSGNWVDSQVLWSGINSATTQYTQIAGLGLATDFAIRWELGGTNTPTFTFSVGYAVKDGLVGTSAGVGRTIYIGPSGVTTTSGFPLFEGQSKKFYFEENIKLFAIAETTLNVKVFDL